MKFWKMEAAGNDFVIFDGRTYHAEDENQLAKRLCDRHFGVGADGILFCEESQVADFRMHYYNSDGSRGEMCGNGIRCISRFAYEIGLVQTTDFSVETDDGIKYISMSLDSKGRPDLLRVNMGKAFWEKEGVKEELHFEEEGRSFSFYRVQTGVPHIVILTEDFLEDAELNAWGKRLEEDPAFPKKTNVNFVKRNEDGSLDIRTWERGAGRTLACATGCAATGAVLDRLGLLKEKTECKTEGGSIFVQVEDGEVIIYGRASLSFKGEI